MYSLCGDDCGGGMGQQEPKPPTTFEEFYEWLLKNSSRRKLSASHDGIVLQKPVPSTAAANNLDDILAEALPECPVCLTRKVDVRTIARSCTRSRYPCEGHRCQCVERSETPSTATPPVTPTATETPPQPESTSQVGEQQQPTAPVRHFPCCSLCLAQVLWNGSNSHMRSQMRFRGHCPICKAEFCHEDLVLFDGVTAADETKQKQKGGNSGKRRGGRGNRRGGGSQRQPNGTSQ